MQKPRRYRSVYIRFRRRIRSWFELFNRIELRYGSANAVFGSVRELLTDHFIWISWLALISLSFLGFAVIGIWSESDGFLFTLDSKSYDKVADVCDNLMLQVAVYLILAPFPLSLAFVAYFKFMNPHSGCSWWHCLQGRLALHHSPPRSLLCSRHVSIF